MENLNQTQTKNVLKTYLHSKEGKVDNVLVNEILTNLVSFSQPEKMNDFDYFFVRKNEFKLYNAFFIKHKDGTEDDFSYNWILKCYDPEGKKKNRIPIHITGMITAARGTIKPQIDEYKRVNATDIVNPHVDHYPVPFIKILADWYELQHEQVIPHEHDKATNMMILSKPYSESFYNYHLKHAQYRILSQKDNCKNGAYGEKINWQLLIFKKEKKYIKVCEKFKGNVFLKKKP